MPKFQIVGAPKWVGLQNYEALWTDPAFWKSAQNTLLFAVISVPLKLVIALGLALLLNRATALSGFYRTVFYLPFLMPAVAGSVVFMLLLTPNAGPVNIALEAMGLNPPDWLLDPKAALWTLILLSLWPLGVETLVFLGGLQNIPKDVSEAAQRQHTPKVAFVAKPVDYVSSSGKPVKTADVDLLVRALSMGKLHHAMMGTAAVAIGTAAAIPGTLVNAAAGGGERQAVRFGHPSGTLRVGAEAKQENGEWSVTKAIMSRSARVLMEGWVRVPGDTL